MEYFKQFYPDVDFDGKEEVKVCCPFHDDTNPSAFINTEKSLFHCFVCDKGMNEETFLAETKNIDRIEAAELLHYMENTDKNKTNWDLTYKAKLWSDEEMLNKLDSMQISRSTIEECGLGLVYQNDKKFLAIPVFYNGVVLDNRKYNIFKFEGLEKMYSDKDAKSGLIIPYDIWRTSKDTTYIFEGEKDMLLARSLGINAITLTGGAKAIPNDLIINDFKGRDVVICYDNDEAGEVGTIKVAKAIKGLANSVKQIKIGEVVKELKEDFYDFITKYDCDIVDFYSLETYDIDTSEAVEEKLTPISVALMQNKIGVEIISNVTVSSEYSDTYAVPTIVEAEKTSTEDSRTETMVLGEKREWVLSKNNYVKMLNIIEKDAKQNEVTSKLLAYCGVPKKEVGVTLTLKNKVTVYKVAITDETVEGFTVGLDLYSLTRLNVGSKYKIKYRIYPHPTKNQKLVGIAHSVSELNDVSNFTLDKSILSKFKIDGTLEERLDYLFQSARHHIASHLNFRTWLMSDMVFNSILDFDYNGLIRGALDVFILGDTRTGKSECTSGLTKLYNFGQFLSLKTSSVVGLIGGSNKVEGSWCNTIGAIPRQHKKLVVLEEFSGADVNFIKTMTDIRSSNELRIARASGELRVPCKLRMITISNPINDAQGNPRFLSSFPNGVKPLMELIKSAEDVARYDGFLLIPKVESRFNPFLNTLKGTAIDPKCYQYKMEWVSTRKPEDVIFLDGVKAYIWDKAEELNKMFECNFPVFDATTSSKLARFCVALASLVLETDESMEKVIVTKDIVDYVVGFLTSIYNQPCFKLNIYKNEYDSYNICSQDDINVLQNLYAPNSVVLDFLANSTKTSRNTLRTISGLDGDAFNPIFSKLVARKFVRLEMDNVYPTEKFRRALNSIDKTLKVMNDNLIKDGELSEYDLKGGQNG